MAHQIDLLIVTLAALFSGGSVVAAPTASLAQPGAVFESPTTATADAVGKYLLQFEDKTVAFCLEQAMRGDSDAHYCAARKLGARANAGDAEAALAHLRAAAGAGNMFAQNDLGNAYSSGKGTPRDREAAFHWFMRSAEAGVPHAMVSVGWYYMCGLGVAINYEKARLWNRRGVDRDHPEGANNLGWLYEHGLGGPRDIEGAQKWYGIAASLGSEEAAERLANLKRPAKLRETNTNDCNA